LGGREKSRDRIAIQVATLLMVFCLGSAGLAYSANEDGREFDQYNGWKVTSFKIKGLPDGMNSEVTGGLAQTGRWKLLTGMTRPPFTSHLLAEDLARLRLFMAQRGYPAARTQPVVTPEPEKQQLSLVIQVDPGEPVHLDRIQLIGWPEGVASPDTTHPDILREGEILNDDRVNKGVAGILGTLMNAGYATVKIRHELKPVGPRRVALVVAVESGEYFRIDEVDIEGCSEDLLGVSRRVMNVKPGTEYSQELINDAALDLRTTQLYRMVVIETRPIAPGSLKLTAKLENGRMKTWEASVGTWSDNPWMVRSSWTHRNLFKRGIGYDVRGVVAAHRLGASTGVFWLGFLSPRARTRGAIGFLVEDEDAYYSEEASIELVQSFRPRKRDIWNFGLGISNTQVEETGIAGTDIPETQGRLLEVWTDRKWDRADDPLFPSRGWYLKTSFTYAPPAVFSEVPYTAIQVDAVKYFRLFNTLTLAGRGRVGWGKPLGDSIEIIATRRFYAGGYNTHRGYERRKLGPQDSEGNARGGEFVVLAGAEVRFPLIWILDGAVFVDSGDLWAVPSDFVWTNIPVAIGADLDLRTPLGPVRIGYAHNVAGLVPGLPEGVWHFGIGYPW